VATALTAAFPDQQTVLDVLSDRPVGAQLPRRQTFRQTGRLLADHIARYNRRVEIVVSRCLERLNRYNEWVDRVTGQISLAPGMPAGPKLRPVDLAAEEQAARTRLGSSFAVLPEDTEQKLERYHRNVSPSIWGRVANILRSALNQRRFFAFFALRRRTFPPLPSRLTLPLASSAAGSRA